MAGRTPVLALVCAALLGVLLLVLPRPAGPTDGEYVLLGWNDLGMHCSNANFADLCVLPPYNNVRAQLIRRGTETTFPELVGTPFIVTYTIENNTYSVGKTDFWTYAQQLFGASLPPNVGLAGKGLAGTADWTGDHFEATGIPVTPYLDGDLTNWNAYQLGALTARDANNTLLATTEIVVPVSNEIHCDNCHHPLPGETVELAILRRHDDDNGTHLVSQRPVLCASCHADPALGTPGKLGVPNFSQAMHEHHGEITNDCYQCHPGPVTQCLRDVMATQHGMTCQACHGSVANVGRTIDQGRIPWLEETPRCGTCHGDAYAEATGALYKNSTNGHGGLYCSACHGSPHAILPSREERDNRQTVALQDSSGTLRSCAVCHGYTPLASGPHGLFATGVRDQGVADLTMPHVRIAPNPSRGGPVEITYRTIARGAIRLEIVDAAGRALRVIARQSGAPGDHTLVWDGRTDDGTRVGAGSYFCRLVSGGKTAVTPVVRMGR